MTRATRSASALNPPPLMGTAALMRRAYAGENLVPLGQALLARAMKNPLDARAYLDFSTVLQLTGNREHALAVQAEAIAIDPLFELPAEGNDTALRLLVLMGPGDLMANTPVEFLVEHSDIDLQLLYLSPDAEWPEYVPDHDVLLVAVGESDANQALLDRLNGYMTAWPRPVINPPERIARLSRDGASQLLQGIPGVEMPLTQRVDRAQLAALGKRATNIKALLPDGRFPLIVRPIGSHAGHDLARLERPKDITAYLENTPADGFFIARFVDYRGADGQFRKYRVVLIDGKPFLSHLAISDHWIIHYANAGMSDSPTKRAEEAWQMEHFANEFAARHADALRAIHERSGLSYVGIDCAELPSGDLLVFEIDNAMIVHAIDPVDIFPYKQPAMTQLFAAFRDMLEFARRGTIAD